MKVHFRTRSKCSGRNITKNKVLTIIIAIVIILLFELHTTESYLSNNVTQYSNTQGANGTISRELTIFIDF